ncbi:RlpA-like double-psi beta-barrel-protein domain-containing protein-containing protein [Boletus edulis BED1]|uniref:RlpA-like double-psi beta-barrel-protein domain-containing protein-containing protein n=1 Tax=Boletus edulis BED1 TaxID=1328754 RepID=A0AAD4BNV9_BOLED|nr:RlpA-like double-psi beta-barrel-protein domain-containing protein-containing protein [Boletus edulis BED1]
MVLTYSKTTTRASISSNVHRRPQRDVLSYNTDMTDLSSRNSTARRQMRAVRLQDKGRQGRLATWYTQDNNAGACGAYHTDNDLIGAMSSARYADSLCGRQVQITNTDNGNTVTVTIADDCPSCENENSIDLSIAAFQQLNSDLGAGVLPSQFPFLASFPVPFFADVLKQVSWAYIS